jgi:hypothetical protein
MTTSILDKTVLSIFSGTFLPWRWRQQVPAKHLYRRTHSHGNASQKSVFLTLITYQNLYVFLIKQHLVCVKCGNSLTRYGLLVSEEEPCSMAWVKRGRWQSVVGLAIGLQAGWRGTLIACRPNMFRSGVGSMQSLFGWCQGIKVGQSSSVGIVTRYRLDGPGIESWWGQDFPHPSRPALEPTQPPIQWVPGLSQG